jgi:cytidylate kinase
MNCLTIVIDGPAGAGKATAGRALASRLGYLYIDTDALYRSAAWLVDHRGAADSPGPALAAMIREANIRLFGSPEHAKAFIDGVDVTDELRSGRIGQLASRLAAIPEVRGALLSLQRRLGEGGCVVMDGRDVGTVVFPDADVKFFLSASLVVRARRRYAELRAGGVDADPEQVLVELEERDRRDSGRSYGPLKAADDAVPMDTTDLDPATVLDRMLAVVLPRL